MQFRFRAYCPIKNEMTYNVMGGGMYNEKNDTYGVVFEYTNAGSMGSYKLSRSTFLKDKNGKEIYHGDVLKMSRDYLSFESDLYYVIDCNGFSMFGHKTNMIGDINNVWNIHDDVESIFYHKICEVVGNIYETEKYRNINPENRMKT